MHRVPTLMGTGTRLSDPSRRRRVRSLSAACAASVALAAFVLAAAPAGAHAALVGSDPADGASLVDAPREVVLTFSQEVAITPGAVEVFGEPQGQVDVGPARHPPHGRQVVIAELPRLADGSYLVTWRVTSADGDPITGSFSFVLTGAAGEAAPPAGTPSTAPRDLTPPAVAQGDGVVEDLPVPVTSRGTELSLVVLRFFGFGAMVLLVGAGLHGLVLSPTGAISRRGSVVITSSAVVLAVTGLLGVAVGAAHAGGRGLTAVADPRLLESFVGTTSARAMVVRAVVAAAVVVLAAGGLRSRATRWLASLSGVVLVLTFVASGHAITGEHVPTAVVADFVHLAAAGVWIGGLASLLVLGGTRDAAITRRFSTLAAWAVVALVVSGSFASWRQLGNVARLVETDYGRLLSAKLILVGVLVALGALSRRAVRRRMPERLGRSVAVEALVAVAVLALTATLIGSAPDGEAPSASGHEPSELVADRTE